MNTIIPTQDTKRFSITNLSDLSGNLQYTRNVSFDEKGYMKLSSRAVMLYKSDDTNPANGGSVNLGYPTSFGRRTLTGDFYIATTDHSLSLTINDSGLSLAGNNVSGGDVPVGAQSTRGKWWQNKFHVTTDTSIKTIDAGGTWASTGVSLNAGSPHPMEVFKNRNTMCVGNQNAVLQLETNYASSTNQLTIPSDYLVSCLAYNNNKMGVGTMISTTLSGQNQEALFFIWDGASSTAQSGYPVGANAVLATAVYKSSWIILTSDGKIKYWTGGAFQDLVTLPFFFKKYYMDYSLILGDIMVVEGELIYINLPADLNYFGVKNERYTENFVGGVLCYDPEVGLYHRYSPSMSKLYELAVASVDTATSILTVSSGTIPATGNPITYTSDPSDLIGGISIGFLYYLIKVDSTRFKLALTKQDALDGNFITLTSNKDGVFFALDFVDYGYTEGVGSMGMALMGNTTNIFDHMIMGGYAYDTTLTPRRAISITVPRFPNRGYAVTPYITSTGMQDLSATMFCKYQPLKDTDSIILKYKDEDVIGLPVMTFQRGKTCTWTSDTVFTTTADISEAYDYLDETHELECEIILGSGAGSFPQIDDIEYSAGTYTVTLKEAVDGAVAGKLMNCKIDNWKVAGTIDSTTDEVGKGWMSIDIISNSKKIKGKAEMRGINTTIEELQMRNRLAIPS